MTTDRSPKAEPILSEPEVVDRLPSTAWSRDTPDYWVLAREFPKKHPGKWCKVFEWPRRFNTTQMKKWLGRHYSAKTRGNDDGTFAVYVRYDPEV